MLWGPTQKLRRFFDIPCREEEGPLGGRKKTTKLPENKSKREEIERERERERQKEGLAVAAPACGLERLAAVQKLQRSAFRTPNCKFAKP